MFFVPAKREGKMILRVTPSLSPENVIIIGAGPLVGTATPGSSRVYSLTKLPADDAVGWAAGGMNFGCMLKNAGYDHIVIKGTGGMNPFTSVF